MNRCDQTFPWRADVQPGCKGTVIGHRIDCEFDRIPATVKSLWTSKTGRDVVFVQYDGVALDGVTFTRNIAGFEEAFRRNRKGKWISLDRRSSRYARGPERSNHFWPSVQAFRQSFPF